jgi:hypothetical protein
MKSRWPLPRPRTGEGSVHENPLALWPPRRWARFDLLSFVMGALATLTFATGLVYLNTDGLFSRTQSFAWLYNHGGPNFWGCFLTILGVVALVCTYLEWAKFELEREFLLTLPPKLHPDRLLGRWVWQVVAVVWVFVGASFVVSWPLPSWPSPGALAYIIYGILAQVVAVQARARRERGSRHEPPG